MIVTMMMLPSRSVRNRVSRATPGRPPVRLGGGPDHLDGDRPILVYRVADLDAAMNELKARGWKPGTTLEIPQGPVCSFHGPGGQRIAIYELSRPGVEAGFVGRRDF